MSTNKLGAASIELQGDSTSIQAAANRGKQAIADFSNDAQRQYAAMDKAGKRQIETLDRQADRIAKTRTEMLLQNIALKTQGALYDELTAKVIRNNAAVETQNARFSSAQLFSANRGLQEFRKDMDEARNATLNAKTRLNEYGLTAKQTAAAMRQVPAQMTDIFVSLAGGQNPLTVLLQQGGQLKDVFGGVVPAARALGSAVMSLVNPWTVLAAAIVGVGVALNDIESRNAALANSLILTGNAAEISADQLRDFARSIDEGTNSSERNAQRVVARVAATGAFTADQIRLVATAAEQMEEATGRSLEKTIAEFASLRDGGTDAILKLNAAIGDGTNVTHFLTEETLKQIEALRKQGDEAGATQLAIEAYARAIGDRAPEISNNLTTMAGLWRGLKSAAADAVDGVINQLDRMVKATHDSAVQTGGFINMMFRLGPNMAGEPAQKHARPPPRGGTGIVDPQQQKALEEFRRSGLQFLSDQAKLERDLAEATRMATAAGLAGSQQLKDRLADIQREFDEKQARKNKSGGNAARALANAQAKNDLQEYKNALELEQQKIQAGTQLLQANYAARNVSAEEYYSQQRSLLEQSQAAEEASLEGQLTVLRARAQTGKDAVDTARQIEQLETDLARVRAESATKLAVLTIQEQEYYERRAQAVEDYRDRLIETNLALQFNTNAQIARIGLSSREAEQQERINQIYYAQAEAVRELDKALARKEITQEDHDAEVQAQQEATDTAVAIVLDGYARMDEAQANWLNGFSSALKDWIDGTKNVAQQVAEITNRALDSATDALVNFATTGKLEIKELLASILKDLVKFFAQRAVMYFVQTFLSGFLNPSAAPTGNFGVPLPGSGGSNFFRAKGDSFKGGTSLPVNTVLSKPTVFRYAKGGMFGMAGEAGAEAIMPLKRDGKGRLGVMLHGGGSPVNIAVQTIVNNDGSASTSVKSEGEQAALYGEFTAHMQRVSKKVVQDEMRPGGMLYTAMHGGR